MRTKQQITYRVRAGRTAIFPMDMLRFAESWPACSDDAIAIERSIKLEIEDRHEIVLMCFKRPDELFMMVQRWHSFGWTVELKDDYGDWNAPGPFTPD